MYTRKTKDVCTIQRYDKKYGWESVSEYSTPDYENPYRSAKNDIKEYRFSERDATYRIVTKRVPL